MAVLGNNALNGVLFRRGSTLLKLIIRFPVKEHYNVGILLNGAGFTKVRKHRAVAGAAFGRAGKLGKNDHGNVKLSCHKLKVTGHFRNLLHTVIRAFAGRHKL